MLLRITLQPPGQGEHTLEFFDADLAREVVRLVTTGLIAPSQAGANGETPDTRPASAAPSSLGRPAPPSMAAASRRSMDDMDAYEQAYEYCQEMNPLGDMRRVVVAARAAELYLNAPGVSASELAGIFQSAGWPQPTDFVQAIRNAAREKFRWLERVPGIPGYYRVTATGRAAVLGEGAIETEPAPAPTAPVELPPAELAPDTPVMAEAPPQPPAPAAMAPSETDDAPPTPVAAPLAEADPVTAVAAPPNMAEAPHLAEVPPEPIATAAAAPAPPTPAEATPAQQPLVEASPVPPAPPQPAPVATAPAQPTPAATVSPQPVPSATPPMQPPITDQAEEEEDTLAAPPGPVPPDQAARAE